tara:strand:+ start:18366 stop:18590 length:225 start_codon:yes stop_codon:yes gene_type:complete
MSNLKQDGEELNFKQAINVLIQAVRIGQTKGAYSLEDATLIMKAVNVFVPPATETEKVKEPPRQVQENDPILNT